MEPLPSQAIVTRRLSPTLALATVAAGNSLLPGRVPILTSGASGLPKHVIDTRILNVNNLPSGPFQLTPGVSFDDYSGSPVHRFYQMWQPGQLWCREGDGKESERLSSPICFHRVEVERRRGQQRQAADSRLQRPDDG